jgi:prepilin-type N-terminal cleavage/methylation domain-containing protein
MEHGLHKEGVMTGANLSPKARARGFTLVELLVVIGIIAVVSAVALPNVVGYMRGARLRGAEDQVAGALQRARNMAIMKNTQMGISFVIQDDTTFWVHVEDTIAGVTAGNVGFTRQGVDFANPSAVLSTRYQLPNGVRFASTAAQCPSPLVPGFAPTRAALRFDRYGVATVPGKTVGGATAPALVLNGGSATTNRINDPAAGDQSVCLLDNNTTLWRVIQIAASGRIVRR